MRHLLTETFSCRQCGAEEFIRVYTFSIRFREVNFSEDPIYDKLEGERYRCASCGETYDPKEVEEVLRRAKRKIRDRE